MKGKRNFKERILAFVLAFAMVMGMVLEPVQLQAAAADGEPVQGEIMSEEPEPAEASANGGNQISLFAVGDNGDGTGEPTEPEPAVLYQISGTVNAAGVPVADARVEVEGTDIGVDTTENGEYVIENLNAGTYTLAVSKNGFSQNTTTVVVTDESVIQDITLTLESFEISSNGTDILINDSLQFSYVSLLDQNDIQGITWYSSDENVLNIDGNGNAIGKTEGSAIVTATLHTKYGDVQTSNSIDITVGKRPVILGFSVEPSNSEPLQGIKKITLTATVKDDKDNSVSINEGQVSFTVIRKENSALGETTETLTIPVVDVQDGIAEYSLTRNKIDFNGCYEFTAQYIGTNTYLDSEPDYQSYGYTTEPIEFKDESENAIPATMENPVKVIYGNSVSIFLKEEKGVTYTAELRNNDVKDIEVAKKENSSKAGYTEFEITAKNVSESVRAVTFEKSDSGETLRTNLYVKVEKREIKIDKQSSLIKYSKIYDKDFTVIKNPDTEDEMTANFNIAESEEDGQKGGIVGQDIVTVNLNDNFQGTIKDKTLIDVTNSQENNTEISFNTNQLNLQGDAADNYTIAEEEIDIPATVTIKKRPLDITIRNGQREFGHGIDNGIGNELYYEWFLDDEFSSIADSWMSIEDANANPTRGFLSSDKEEFILPNYEEVLKENLQNSSIAKPKTYASVLEIKTDDFLSKNKVLNNYAINVIAGDLKVTEENISNIENYINFDPSEYKNNHSMYISKSEEGITIWVNAEVGILNLNPVSGKLYNDVILVNVDEQEVNGKDGISLKDAGYVFDMADRSGEEIELTLKMRRNPESDEEAGNVVDSQEFNYSIKLDGDIPKVNISNIRGEATVIDNLKSAITFGTFGKETYYTDIKVEDNLSGLKQWQYAILPLDRDIKDGEDLNTYIQKLVEKTKEEGKLLWSDPITNTSRKVEITRKAPGEESFVANNYVVLVKPYDNVSNSKTYTSMGVILDNNDPYVEIDLAEGQEQKEIYNSSVNLTATVKDTNQPAGDAISGIQKVTYQIAVGEINLEKAKEISLFERDEDKTYSLEELRNELKTLPIMVDAKTFNSNDVWVRVTALDNSGNEYSTSMRLKIDITKPIVHVEYETEASENYAPYYNKERTAVITIKERNVLVDNINQLYFVLKREQDSNNEEDSERFRYNFSDLKSLDGITAKIVEDTQDGKESWELTDDRSIQIKVTFKGDNKYDFNVNCVDGAGWRNEENNQSYFVIDKTEPKMEVSYYTEDGMIGVSDNEQYRVYQQKPINTKVEIVEHNFALEGQEIQVNTQVSTTKEQGAIPDYYAQQRVNNGKVWFSQNVDQYASIYTFSTDANYTHSITYTDLAGNSVTYGPGYFTVDDTNPTGSVSINGFGFWETLLHNITFGLFNPSSVDVEMKAADYTSPINPIQYFRTADAMTREQLEAYNWGSTDTASWENPGYAAFTVNPDEQFIVYTKVTDYAGNYEYFSSDGMIVDSTKPAPTVTITNLSQAQNGIFNEDVTLQIDVEDKYGGNTYSGLERVWYTVSATGNVSASQTIELLNNSNNRVQGNQTFSQVITVPANVYNSNDVKVQAFAVDFSGNQGESEITELKIDVTNPSISVSWDLNNPMNGKYYKETRTATVTVTDRNFDPNNVRFTITNTDGTQANIGGWSSSSNIGVSDSATSTCQVSFPADGDYTFTLGCTDLAGNSAEYGQTDEFTIDKTVPEISVSYDNNNARNGNYYKEARTATVTVREHNFNAADVKAAITASLEGRGISTPSISGFSGSGDVHTATVRYAADGDYTFDVEYTDMAGNQASDYTPDQFTVDLTAPEVEITDVEDKSANNDVVSPSVKATDVNYDSKNVTVTITGANNGKVDINKVVSAVENGQTMKFSDFARQEKMDDLYTLTAKAVDLAGNEKEESILFSVNRYGSVYVLDDDTKEWLSTKDYTYINEEKEVGVIEYNVDTIKDSTITVNRDGELVNLKAKTDYTVTSSGTEAQWKENHYTMKAENFAQEGNYAVILSTQDEAANAMNNTSVKKSSGNLPIEFAVDKTAPTVVISGVEDGGSYRSAERTMTVDAKDNLALDEVSVDIDGNTTVYQAEELKETDGVIDVVIGSANDFQEIQVTASDAAGNVLGQKQVNGKGEPVALSVLVTPNVMVQYYMNKPLFFGSIIGVLAVAGIIIFLVWRRRQADKNGR